jgi:hypothetical protein
VPGWSSACAATHTQAVAAHAAIRVRAARRATRASYPLALEAAPHVSLWRAPT